MMWGVKGHTSTGSVRKLFGDVCSIVGRHGSRLWLVDDKRVEVQIAVGAREQNV